jgi:hypothetical protein
MSKVVTEMTDTVETLTRTDQDYYIVLGFFIQAVQAVEAVHAWTQEHYRDNPDPHNLMNGLADLKADLRRITAKHNEFVGKIQLAKQEAERNGAQETSDDPC